MKTIVIIETRQERERFLRAWESWLDHRASLNKDAHMTGIAYDLRKDGWHIYNGYTMKEEIVAGDIAGLCGASAGNFPFAQ